MNYGKMVDVYTKMRNLKRQDGSTILPDEEPPYAQVYKGYNIDDMRALYRSMGGDWVVIDKASGLQIARGQTRPKAIEAADKVQESIEKIRKMEIYEKDVEEFQDLIKKKNKELYEEGITWL